MGTLKITRENKRQDCVQLPTSADNVTLLAFAAERQPCSNRSTFPVRRAHSSKLAAAAFSGRLLGRTDGQTDGRSTVSQTLLRIGSPCDEEYQLDDAVAS